MLASYLIKLCSFYQRTFDFSFLVTSSFPPVSVHAILLLAVRNRHDNYNVLFQHPEQTIMNDDLLFKRSPNWKFPHYHLRQMFLTGFDYDRQKGNVTAMKEHVASFIKRYQYSNATHCEL